MTKNNPLFVDSTKFHGDRIGTLIELSHVLIYDGESVVALVTNHQGELSRVPMTVNRDGNFEAKVWLSHQKSITCQFLIEKDGQEIFHSAARSTRAQYAVIERWQPVLDENPLPPPAETAPTPHPDVQRTAQWASHAESLIQKWDL